MESLINYEVFGVPIFFWWISTACFQMMALILIYERFHTREPTHDVDCFDLDSVECAMREIMTKAVTQYQLLKSESQYQATEVRNLRTTLQTERLENHRLRDSISDRDEENANLRLIIRDQEQSRSTEERWAERQLMAQIEAIKLAEVETQSYYSEVYRFTKFQEKERVLQQAQVTADKIRTQVDSGVLIHRDKVSRIEVECHRKLIDTDKHYQKLQDDVTFGGLIRRRLYDHVIKDRDSANFKARCLDRELELLNGVLREKDRRMAGLEDRASDADLVKKQLQNVRTQRDQGKQELNKKELQVNAAETKAWAREQSIEVLEKKVQNHDELEATRDRQAESILALQTELHEAQVESQDLQQVSCADKDEINILKTIAGNLEQRLQTMSEVLNFGGVDRLEVYVRDLRQEKRQMEEQARVLEQEKSILIRDLKQQKCQNKKRVRNLEQEKSTMSQECECRVTKLEDEKKNISQNLQQAQSDLGTTMQDLANARDQLATSQRDLTQMRNERDSSQRAHQDTVTEEGQRKRDLDTRIGQLEGQLRDAATQADQNTHTSKTRITELQGRLGNAATQVNQANQNMQNGNARIAELEGLLRNAGTQAAQTDQNIQNGNAGIRQLEGRLRDAASQIAQANQTIQNGNMRITELEGHQRQAATQADQDVRARNSRIEQLEGDLRRAQTKGQQQTNAPNTAAGAQSGQGTSEAQKQIDALTKLVRELQEQLKQDKDKSKRSEAEANTELEKFNDQTKQLRKDKTQLLKTANEVMGLRQTITAIRSAISWKGSNDDLIDRIQELQDSIDEKNQEMLRSIDEKNEENARLANKLCAFEARWLRYGELLGEVCGGSFGQRDVLSVLQSLLLHDMMLDQLFDKVADPQYQNNVDKKDLRNMVEEVIDPEDCRKKLEVRVNRDSDDNITVLVERNSEALHLRESLVQTIEELPPNSLLTNTIHTMILEQWKHSHKDSNADANADSNANADGDSDADADAYSNDEADPDYVMA